MIALLSEARDLRLSRETPIPDLDGVSPDAVDIDSKVVVEAYAHQGQLKPGQKSKLSKDILKLAYMRQSLGNEWRVVLCVSSFEIERHLKGSAWLAKAAARFGIEVVRVDLPEHHADMSRKAQDRQRMING